MFPLGSYQEVVEGGQSLFRPQEEARLADIPTCGVRDWCRIRDLQFCWALICLQRDWGLAVGAALPCYWFLGCNRKNLAKTRSALNHGLCWIQCRWDIQQRERERRSTISGYPSLAHQQTAEICVLWLRLIVSRDFVSQEWPRSQEKHERFFTIFLCCPLGSW